MKERINWVDVARGIGVLLVIYGHGLAVTPLRFIIYSFHMPLFFFLSGLVFHKRKNEKYLTVLKKDFKRILIPYFIFAAISFTLWLSNIPLDRIRWDLVFNQIIGIFYGSGNNGYLAINIVLWFLPCLFIVKQMFWFISRLDIKLIIPVLFLFSALGYYFHVFLPNLKLPFGFESALTGVVFFGLGYMWNFIPDKYNQKFKKYTLVFILILIVSTITFSLINFNLHNHQVDLRLNRINNYFLFYMSALSGILTVILLSMKLNKNKILEYFGRNSLLLFVWHLVVFSYISDFVFLFLTSEEVIKLRNIYLAPFYSVVSIFIILTISKTIRKSKSLILESKLF